MAEEIETIGIHPVLSGVLPNVSGDRRHILDVVGQAVIALTAPDAAVGEVRHRISVGTEIGGDIQIPVTAGMTVEHQHHRCGAGFIVKGGTQQAAEDTAAVTVHDQRLIKRHHQRIRRRVPKEKFCIHL